MGEKLALSNKRGRVSLREYCPVITNTTPSTASRPWSDLPPELLDLILEKLASNFVDVRCFKAVCSSWNCAGKCYTSASLVPNQSPWMMLTADKNDNENSTLTSCFFSLKEKKVYGTKMMDVFEGFGGKAWCAGSSHGWLVLWNENGIIHLRNPISGSKIILPSILRQNLYYISKAVVSSDPSCDNNFVVVIIKGGIPAFYQHGQHNCGIWTDLRGNVMYDDIVFHNSQLFALPSRHDSIRVWDFAETFNKYPMNSMGFEFGPLEMTNDKISTRLGHWFLESMGELLFVDQIMITSDDRWPYRDSVHFYIYKLNLTTKEWEDVEHLPGRTLCLSSLHHAAVSIPTRNFPEIEENSIYFAHNGAGNVLNKFEEDVSCVSHDLVLVYNLKDKSCEAVS